MADRIREPQKRDPLAARIIDTDGSGALKDTRARFSGIVAYGAFFLNGLMYAALVSRIPAIGTQLSLSTSQLGVLLLFLSVGAVSGLPIAGTLIHRLGAGRVVTLGFIVAAAGLVALALGLATGSSFWAAAALCVVGVGMGNWEVSMNVIGARVAHLIDSEGMLPRLHATLSLGTVAGALAGALSAKLSISLALQNGITALLLIPAGIAIGQVARSLETDGPAEGVTSGDGGLWQTWCERRTLLLGLFVLGFALTEGTANEWLAYVLVDGLKTSDGTGAFAFAVFVTAMTFGRIGGGVLVSRVGRVRILRVSVAIALCGVLTVALSDSVGAAFAGAVLWGVGAALGFPVGIAAAADDAHRAAARVSVVSTLGYVAFLGGPPLLGILGGRFGIQQAILVVCIGLALSYVAASATSRLPGVADETHA